MHIEDIKAINIIECVGKQDGGIGYIMAIKMTDDETLMFGYWSNGIKQVISSRQISDADKNVLLQAIKHRINVNEFIESYENYKIKNDSKELTN